MKTLANILMTLLVISSVAISSQAQNIKTTIPTKKLQKTYINTYSAKGNNEESKRASASTSSRTHDHRNRKGEAIKKELHKTQPVYQVSTSPNAMTALVKSSIPISRTKEIRDHRTNLRTFNYHPDSIGVMSSPINNKVKSNFDKIGDGSSNTIMLGERYIKR